MLRFLLISLICGLKLAAQGGPTSHITSGRTLPTKCSYLSGDVFFLTTGNIGLYTCGTGGTYIGSASAITLPLSVVSGGTGTTSPILTAGSNVTITGTWPNNTISTTSGSGTVTSVATSGPITGGTFTTSGTIACATCLVSDGSYTNPSWFVSIPSTKVTGLPTFPTGTIIGTTDTQALTNKTVDGVSPTTMAFMDATSSVQTQLNSKGTGSGTVTSVATSSPLGGGTITGTGTLTCATCGVTGSPLSQFASTTSAQLLATLSDATGTGALNFGLPAASFPANAKTSTYQVLASDFASCKTIPVASGTFTITLVASGSQPTSGQCIFVVNYGTGVVTIARSGQNINGAAANLALGAATAPNPNSMIIFSDGTNYFTNGGTTKWFTQSNAWCNASTSSATMCLGWNTGQDFIVNNVGQLSFSSTGTISGTVDVDLDRDAAGILGITNGTQGTTAANYRALKASAVYSGGTTFTATGLTVGTLVGGATAGTFTLGANGAGTVVVTMGNSATAPTGWACSASDRTTLTVLADQSASTTTTATINFPAGALSGDVVSFYCVGY